MTRTYEIGAPIFLPERVSDLPRLLSRTFAALQPDLLRSVAAFVADPSPEGLLHFEETVQHLLMVVGSHVVAGAVAYLHEDAERVEASIDAVRQAAPHPIRHRGWKNAPVRFLGGTRLTLWTPYVSEDRTWRPGPTRGVGRRGAEGSGCYPVLAALGIWYQATPALQSEVTRQTVRTASFAEPRRALAERGIHLNLKTVRTLSLKVGAEALKQRQARIEAAAQGQVFSDELVGKRIVISTDGGRVRLREGGKRGRRGKKGCRRFQTPWREPKLIVIYVIDENGHKVKTIDSIYDGTFGGPDATFEILIAELLLRGAAKAKQIILTADGAWWIWNRADALAEALGLAPSQLIKVADFYHAVEHLTDIADLCARWSASGRRAWVRRMRRHLKAGRIDRVLEAARGLMKGRNRKKIGTEVEYFEERREFMQYARFSRRHIPLGSGAMESAVRRVVNLRMKGPSIFWREENAERMLHMRAYYKAGRWDELMLRVMHRTACAKPAATRIEVAA